MAIKKSPNKKSAKPGENQDPDDTEDNQESTDDPDDSDTSAAEEANRRINAIVTSRVKREMKGVLSTLAAIQESMKTLSAKREEPEDSDDEDESSTKSKIEIDPKMAKKLSRMEKELADEKATRIQAQKERADEQERARKQELRQNFQSALAEHGLTDPRLMRAALSQLEEDGHMVRDDDGKPKFKGQDKYGLETMYDPKAGLKTWILAEGKSFIPAVEASGSGSGGARVNGQSQNLTKGEIGKLSPQQKAAIELERASSGQPPLEHS